MNTKQTIQPRLLRMRQLAEYCSLSPAYLHQQIAKGNLNPGYNISVGVRVWEKSEIDLWLDRQMRKG